MPEKEAVVEIAVYQVECVEKAHKVIIRRHLYRTVPRCKYLEKRYYVGSKYMWARGTSTIKDLTQWYIPDIQKASTRAMERIKEVIAEKRERIAQKTKEVAELRSQVAALERQYKKRTVLVED